MRSALFFIAAAVLLGGCTTITRLDGSICAEKDDGAVPVEAVQVMNTNWLLLSFAPIASGDPEHPDTCTYRWFTNTVTLQNQLDMLEAEVRRAGADRATDVETEINSESAFFFLLQREKIHTSAVLVKDAQP